MMAYVRGQDEDEFDHIGRHIAAVMRRLPRRKSLVLHQQILQLLIDEETE